MNRISNINKIPKEYMLDPDFQSKMKTVLVGDAMGTEKIYINIDFVKPGANYILKSETKENPYCMLV